MIWYLSILIPYICRNTYYIVLCVIMVLLVLSAFTYLLESYNYSRTKYIYLTTRLAIKFCHVSFLIFILKKRKKKNNSI